MRVRTTKHGINGGRGLFTPNLRAGTILVLVVALLAMLALMATTFLVTSRYDKIATAGAGISHQMEMLLSMLESDIRRKLAEDLWGNDAAHNPGASNHEAYDGPDSDHAWLRGICGNLIDWEGNDSGHMQYVVQSDGSGWKTLAGTDAKNLQFRYAVLIQDLGGLVNVNVARRPDPDTMGNAYAVSPDVNDTENWPHSIWAFHALRSDEQWWGYWWYPFGTRGYGTSLGGGTEPIYSGMGVHFRGGGPATGANLEWLVRSAELKNIDRHFRNIKHYGRQFDIQDELDLRFPNSSSNGSLCESLLEQLAPSVFASQRRRLVTAIGRTTNWQRRREPIHMHPYGNQFWTDSLAHLPAADRNPDWCMEWWRFKVDYPCFDDLVRYFQESRMGYRIPVVMGTTFAGMAADNEFDIYLRLTGDASWNRRLPVWPNLQSQLRDFPMVGYGRSANGVRDTHIAEWRIKPYEGVWSDWRRNFPPFAYTDWLVDFDKRNHETFEYLYGHAPTLTTLLLSNTMAVMGVPSPKELADAPDAEATYAPRGAANIPSVKESRVKAYRRLAGILHLNMADYQDPNLIPGMLRSHQYYNRFSQSGDRAGAEDRPYITEVVIEFEPWPDYAAIYDHVSYGVHSLLVKRVDKGTSAETAATEGDPLLKGLKVGDKVVAAREGGTSDWTDVTTLANLRQRFAMLVGKTVDLKVSRAGEEKVILGITIGAAVKTIAVEVYNPYDHSIRMNDNSFYGRARFRYNVGVPQQWKVEGENAYRAILSDYSYARNYHLPAGKCMLYIERRGTSYSEIGGWMNGNGLSGIEYCPTNKNSYSVACGNLVNLREHDGEVVLHIGGAFPGGWRFAAWLSDVVRNTAVNPFAAPMPVSTAVLGQPAGIKNAFADAAIRMATGHLNPVVRLYRPLYMESRATQFMAAWNSWTEANLSGHTPTSRLGKRDATEDDFTVSEYSTDYRNIDARGFMVTTTNRGFRYGADVSRVTRLTQPRLRNVAGDLKDGEPESSKSGYTHIWYYETDPMDAAMAPERLAPTEVVDARMRSALADVVASGKKTITDSAVAHIFQKTEARLRFSPYSPTTPAEKAECAAYYDFLDAFTVGGSLYDNIDNNQDGVADERIPYQYFMGSSAARVYDILPPGLPETYPVNISTTSGVKEQSWRKEASNVWPAYGRINVNTAPKEILQNCLMAPSSAVRQQLGQAIWDARGGKASQSNSSYKPFKSLGDLYGRVSVREGYEHGFDRYGFDGNDNQLPDMPSVPYAHVDELEERNYLWRINSEIITLRSDTFAVYLRFQARRYVNDKWKMVAERRVYSLWDRAACAWPPRRHDNRLHTDFITPQRIGIQVFGY